MSVSKRGIGRPTKLSPQVKERFLKALRMGNYREVAAEWSGISTGTFCRWMNDPRKEYQEFRESVIAAEREAEIRVVSQIMNAAADDPKHGQWWLERKFPDRWGRKDRHEITGADGGALNVVLKWEANGADSDRDNAESSSGAVASTK